jgi:uncharacterized protein YukE
MADELKVDPVALQQRAAVIADVAGQLNGAVEDLVTQLAKIRMDTGGTRDALVNQLHASYDGPAEQLVDAARGLAKNVSTTADNLRATGRNFAQVEAENAQAQQG